MQPSGPWSRSSLRLLLGLLAAVAMPVLAAAPTVVAGGTAFELSDSGHLLTNAHVVAGCKAVRVRIGDLVDDAVVLGIDPVLDLALLLDVQRGRERVQHRRLVGSPMPHAHFRADRPYPILGEAIAVVGFPLVGIVGGINVTTGVVSATIGPRERPGLFQITAPVQPGNSGGPVLDAAGLVVGVVVAQLDAAEVTRQVGAPPQNVNFAIQAREALDFVRRTAPGVLDDAPASPTREDLATTAGRARAFTLPVQCLQ